MEFSPKTFWNYFEIKVAADKVDTATKFSFGKVRVAKLSASLLLILGKVLA